MHKPLGRVHFVVFEKFTSAHLFQIARERSFDYLLIVYMEKCEMVKQKKRTRITQSGKNCTINCTIQGARFILNEKISLVLTKPRCTLANHDHNPEIRCVICTVLHFLHSCDTFCTPFSANQNLVVFSCILLKDKSHEPNYRFQRIKTFSTLLTHLIKDLVKHVLKPTLMIWKRKTYRILWHRLRIC